jgi:hypothetical protein
MALEDLSADGLEKAHDEKRLGPSFHGRLLIRSSASRADHRNRRMFATFADRWGWLGQLIGQGAIFAGGLAIGGGVMLLRRGEEGRVRPEIMIGFGIGCILFAIVAQLLVKEATRRVTSPSRS